MGSAALGGVLAPASVTAAAAAPDVPGGRDLVETRRSFDPATFDATLGRAADIRQLWQNLAFEPSVFNNIKNALNALQFAFEYPVGRIATAIANHGPSSAYTYSDAIWTTYRIGEFFGMKTKAGAPIATNVFFPRVSRTDGPADPNDEASPFQDTSIAALQARGVVFLTCHTAVEEQARALVAAGHAPAGMSATDVAVDILTHLIPGAFVVPSMVATIGVLQHRFGYSYITIQS